MISVIIAKPTKDCNADCSYCSSPPEGAWRWGDRELEAFFQALAGHTAPRSTLIWHGGEPLLMGPDFFRKARALADTYTPGMMFSVQTNLLLYKSSRWKDVFQSIFQGSVSTSYDPDELQRTIKGDPARYTKQFFSKLDEVTKDGFRPMVIGTFSESTATLMPTLYEQALAANGRYDIRLNYCSPVGREQGSGLVIDPVTYGNGLVEIYRRWIDEMPNFSVTPLDQMLRKTLGDATEQCPWTRQCGGQFLGVMPNGDVYNCGEFSDLDESWRYGNILKGTYHPPGMPQNMVAKAEPIKIIPSMLSSEPARQIKRRVHDHPIECTKCPHFNECQGGCVRDVVLYDRGIGGKYMYCASWTLVFDAIKASILDGSADRMIKRYGFCPDQSRDIVLNEGNVPC